MLINMNVHIAVTLKRSEQDSMKTVFDLMFLIGVIQKAIPFLLSLMQRNKLLKLQILGPLFSSLNLSLFVIKVTYIP